MKWVLWYAFGTEWCATLTGRTFEHYSEVENIDNPAWPNVAGKGWVLTEWLTLLG